MPHQNSSVDLVRYMTLRGLCLAQQRIPVVQRHMTTLSLNEQLPLSTQVVGGYLIYKARTG